MQELKVLHGSIYDTNLVQKILSESATIRRAVRKCHNQKNNKTVQHSKGIYGKCLNQKFYQGVHHSCVLLFRDCYNLKYMKEYRNQKYCQGVSQFKYLELISSLLSDGGYHFRGSK